MAQPERGKTATTVKASLEECAPSAFLRNGLVGQTLFPPSDQFSDTNMMWRGKGERNKVDNQNKVEGM